ncbi:hypothetical protein [Frankia sp. QA3]|uniref:hypothetical protein n=1 Tax=Frankia sp. QA3 TaxID=710111 RepID=UPI000269CB2C|nr:hypothetical protein [Frankia sp. QA3]EIV95243.1 hypothetical protein FraQA3DRAFT_5051 [Frankia sp. QA3]
MNRAGPAAADRATSAQGATSAVTRIDQIVYAWSRRTRAGAEGYFPIASSLSSAVTRSWNGLLAAQVEADDSPVDHPPTALAYVVGAPDRPVRDDPYDVPDAALVHRVQAAGRSGAGRGRLRAHVLIGRADYLTERVALALYAAGGATAGGARTTPRLPPLHLDDLTAQRRAGERTLRQAARVAARRNRLAALVSTVLTWSWTDRPFVVSHTGSDEAVTLMWALVEMLEGVLPYRLTFSTHATSPSTRAAAAPNQPASASASNRETSTTGHRSAASDGTTTGMGPSGPRFLFVPVPPELAPGADPAAIHVDPRVAPPVPSAISDAAHLLVDVYGRGGIRGVSGLLALVGDETFQPRGPEHWCRRLVAASGRDAAVARLGEQPGPDPAGPQPAGPQPISSYPIGQPPPSHETAPAQPSSAPAAAPPTDTRSPAAAPPPGERWPTATAPPVQGGAIGAGRWPASAARPAARQARAVAEHLHDAYELLLAPGRADGDGADPVRRLIAILTGPVGLPVNLPSAERLRGQLRRVAGQLTAPGAGMSGRMPKSPAGPEARDEPASREQGRALVVAGVLDRLGEVDPAERARVAADVEAAVIEEQRQVEGALTALADDLAALRGPSPTRGAEESLRQAIPPLTAGLESVFSSYRLPTASGSALRLATETLDALRTFRPGAPPTTTDTPSPADTPRPADTPSPADQPHPADERHPAGGTGPAAFAEERRRPPTATPRTLDIAVVPAGPPPARPDVSVTSREYGGAEADHPAGPDPGFEVTVTALPPAAPSPATAATADRRELERAAQAAVTRHVAAAYRMEWSHWDGRLHPVDRLLAALGVPLGVSLADSAHDPLIDRLESPTELRELAALRDLFDPAGPAGSRSRPGPARPPGRRADVLARAASDVTQAITRLAADVHLAELDRAAYVTAVHTAVATMHRQIVQLLAELVADLASLAAAPAAGPDRPDGGHRAARVRELLGSALRTVFDRFGLTEGFAFADALADELAWLAAGAELPATAPGAAAVHRAQAPPPGPGTGMAAPDAPAAGRAVMARSEGESADGESADGWPAESPAAAVVRLLRETRAWGADAFRLLVLYAPRWYGAEDIRYAIAGAAAFPVAAGPPPPAVRDDDGPGMLAAGARPFLERLAAAGPGGSQVVDTVARVLDLYVEDGEVEDGEVEDGEVEDGGAAARPRRPASSQAELHALATELTARIPPAAADVRDPAVAFLDACGPGRPDAARVFGLLVWYVPSWDDAWDLYEAIWSWGAPHRDGMALPDDEPASGADLAVAAERYFRRALRTADADEYDGEDEDDVGLYPADLERVVRRLVALYLPDDPRLRAARELPRFVESRVIAEIAANGAAGRRRRSFGLPVFAFTLAAAVLALLALVR